MLRLTLAIVTTRQSPIIVIPSNPTCPLLRLTHRIFITIAAWKRCILCFSVGDLTVYFLLDIFCFFFSDRWGFSQGCVHIDYIAPYYNPVITQYQILSNALTGRTQLRAFSNILWPHHRVWTHPNPRQTSGWGSSQSQLQLKSQLCACFSCDTASQAVNWKVRFISLCFG